MFPIFFFFLILGAVITVMMGVYAHRRVQIHFKSIAIATAAFFVYGLPLELLFFNNKVWTFGHEYSLGLWLYGMPIEEYLFYLIMIPYFMILPRFFEALMKKK